MKQQGVELKGSIQHKLLLNRINRSPKNDNYLEHPNQNK